MEVIDFNNVGESQTSPTYPPGFTPNDVGVTNVDASNVVVEEPRQNEDQEEGEVVVSDYFVMVRGVWVPSGKSLLIISIYAPQKLSEKRMLWDYLRYLSDHRLILMRESHYDYGPTQFKFYHYWFEFDGFDKFVEDSWKEIRAVDLESAVSKEEIKRAVISNGGNSSFITLIPKILNANMVKDFRPISLIGSVYKIVAKVLANRLVMVLGDLKKRKQSMIFKVDFKKAYDLVRWDFIDTILKKFGFGDKWCNWIGSCLQSSRGSVLVNGSPTSEFQFFKGLKQGDSLSPFLFILVMERLHVSFQRVVDADVFHRASGLRINMNKNKLMRISIESSKVEQAVEKIGCMALKMPFKYLGSKVGDLMSRTISWNEVLECMVARLSRWKLKTISIGGRLTLLKSVLGSIPIYHMSMFKVLKTVLQTMEAIRARFLMEHMQNRENLVGLAGKSFIKPKCGDGTNTSFQNDAWRGDVAFKDLMPRLYMLENMKDVQLSHEDLEWSFRRKSRSGVEQHQLIMLHEKIEGFILSNTQDRWTWSLEGSGDFFVSLVRKVIDAIYLPRGSVKTRWIKEVPLKINIHAWKVTNDYLSTKFNLSRR
nr:RNA-directed DNA polymerase, eukaryota [Tanacetum cinerariifolium]